MQVNIHWQLFIIYLVVVNITNFCLFAWDKRCAKKGAWRISEQQLLMGAVIGGSIGGFLGMHVFHHKTLHPKFRYGIPIIILLQVLVLLALLAFFLFR